MPHLAQFLDDIEWYPRWSIHCHSYNICQGRTRASPLVEFRDFVMVDVPKKELSTEGKLVRSTKVNVPQGYTDSCLT